MNNVIINKENIGFLKKVDIGYTKDKIYVRKFDSLGICFYERLYDSWDIAYKKFKKLKMRLIRHD